MKNLRSLFVVYIAMFTVMFSAAQFAFAQESYQPPADIEEFRRNLDQMIVDLYRHRETFRQNPAVREALEKNTKFDSAPALAAVRQQIQQMNYDELRTYHLAFTTHMPNWREVPQMLGGIADRMSARASQKVATANATPNTSNAITPDNCQTAFDAEPSFTDQAVLAGVSLGAEAYTAILAQAGLSVHANYTDEGENYYFVAQKN